jgi:hypothetical protein
MFNIGGGRANGYDGFLMFEARGMICKKRWMREIWVIFKSVTPPYDNPYAITDSDGSFSAAAAGFDGDETPAPSTTKPFLSIDEPFVGTRKGKQ